MWALQVALFAFTWYEAYVPTIPPENLFFNRGNWALIGLYGLLLYFFTHIFGGYRIGYLRITEIGFSNALAIICCNVIEYFELCLVTNDYVLVEPMVVLTLVEITFILPYGYFVRKWYVHMYPPRKMIVIYGEYEPDDLIAKINTRKDKYDICAMASINMPWDKLKEKISNYKAVVLCDLPGQTRNEILKFCYKESIRVYVTPKISDVILRGADEIHLFDTPLLLSRAQGLTIEQRFMKRTMDIVLSLLGLIILSPFMLITAIMIKAHDGGPVFYSQPRLTRDGKEFKILKFRSMGMNSEEDGARLAMKDDDRVTPIGRIIRPIHFDEIPQLINILVGDMSIVGPRPERQEIADEYSAYIPEFPLRLKVKAGLTGYAQVYGKYNTTPYDKLKLDITYIEKYSIWLDIKLLLMTMKVIFQKENSEGVNSDQITAMKK